MTERYVNAWLASLTAPMTSASMQVFVGATVADPPDADGDFRIRIQGTQGTEILTIDAITPSGGGYMLTVAERASEAPYDTAYDFDIGDSVAQILTAFSLRQIILDEIANYSANLGELLAWNPATNYVRGDMVRVDEGIVVATVANIAIDPEDDPVTWKVYVSDGPEGAPGEAGEAGDFTWGPYRQAGVASVATGSEPHPSPYDFIGEHVMVGSTLPPLTEPIVFDMLWNSQSFWADPDDRPTIQPGAYVGGPFPVDPGRASVLQGEMGTVDIITVGPEAGGTPDIFVRSVATKTTGSGGGAASNTLPIAGGYNADDLLLEILGLLVSHDVQEPAGWTDPASFVPEIADPDNASMHLSFVAKLASLTELGNQSASWTLNGPQSIVGLAIANPFGVEVVDDSSTYVGSGETTVMNTLPSVDSNEENQLGIWVALARQVTGQQETIVGPPELEELASITTVRVGSTTNVALWVGSLALADIGTYGAGLEWSLTNGATSRWLGAAMVLAASPEPASPGQNPSLWLTGRRTG